MFKKPKQPAQTGSVFASAAPTAPSAPTVHAPATAEPAKAPKKARRSTSDHDEAPTGLLPEDLDYNQVAIGGLVAAVVGLIVLWVLSTGIVGLVIGGLLLIGGLVAAVGGTWQAWQRANTRR